jgi:hypothetical protein
MQGNIRRIEIFLERKMKKMRAGGKDSKDAKREQSSEIGAKQWKFFK